VSRLETTEEEYALQMERLRFQLAQHGLLNAFELALVPIALGHTVLEFLIDGESHILTSDQAATDRRDRYLRQTMRALENEVPGEYEALWKAITKVLAKPTEGDDDGEARGSDLEGTTETLDS
jgi:hypothetical protein